MASEVAAYMAQWKALLAQGEQTTMQVMADRYALVQAALKGQLAKLADDVAALAEKGETPTPGLLQQIATYKKWQVDSAKEFAKYTGWADDVGEAEQEAAAKAGVSAAAQALEKKPHPPGVPEEVDMGEEVLAGWDQGAVESMSGMTAGGPLQELLQQGYGVMEQEIAQRLIEGITRGQNAVEVATDCADAMGIGLDRIMTIARTELNRAYRDSCMDAYRSSGAVERYMRMSARDELVCESCLAADGDTFDVAIDPDDHPNCRCTVVPLLPGEEPSDLGLTDSRAWFDSQPESVQRGIMGAGRLALYKQAADDAEAARLWDRMVSRDVHPVWGGTLRATPLKDLAKGLGGIPKDGAPTPEHPLPAKALAPYPTASTGHLGDLAPNDKAYKAFLETDAGAKAFQAAINAALGLGPEVDEDLVAQHIATVLAKDYQSAGALNYYLKTQGFNLNPAEAAKVKEAWKEQKAAQKAAADALAKQEAAKAAEALKAAQADEAEKKLVAASVAKETLDLKGNTIQDALDVLKGVNDPLYKDAFHDAFVAKYDMTPEAAAAHLEHATKMQDALEVLISKDYKSPGSVSYWLSHAGAKAFDLSADDAKTLKAQWMAYQKEKWEAAAEAAAAKAQKEAAAEAVEAKLAQAEVAGEIDYKKVEAAYEVLLQVDAPKGGGWDPVDFYSAVLNSAKVGGETLTPAEKQAAINAMGLGPGGWDAAVETVSHFPSAEKPGLLYDGLVGDEKAEADKALESLGTFAASDTDLEEAMNYMAGYGVGKDLSVPVQAAVIEKWAADAGVALPAPATDLVKVSGENLYWLSAHIDMVLDKAEEDGAMLTSAEKQEARQALFAAGIKDIAAYKGSPADEDVALKAAHKSVVAALQDFLHGPAEPTGPEGEHLAQTLAHDMTLAGVDSVGQAELYLAGNAPDVGEDVKAAAIKALQEAGQIPKDAAELPPLPHDVQLKVDQLVKEAAGHDEALVAMAAQKATEAAQQSLAVPTSKPLIKAKQAAAEAFHAYLGGGHLAEAAAETQPAAKLEGMITELLGKGYTSSGAAEYWVGTVHGKDLSAAEKKVVLGAWKDAQAGKAVDAKAVAEKFVASHGGKAAAATAKEAYDASNLQAAIETVLDKNYQSPGAVHYWLNSSQGANLTAEEKQAVMQAWKDTKAGKIVVPEEVAAKFAAEHAGEAAVPAPMKAPSPSAAKLASGSEAKVDAAFQKLPIVAGYAQVMTQIDAMADLTEAEKAALKEKWSIANAISKSNMHPAMTVDQAKQFFGSLGIQPGTSAFEATMDEWGKLKGFDWHAKEAEEAKAAAEEALKAKTTALAQAALDAGATTGPQLDAYLASLASKPSQKEKAAIQKEWKGLVNAAKEKAAAEAAAAKAAAEAEAKAAIYAKAQEFLDQKATLLQVESMLKKEGRTTTEINKVKAAMRDIRKGGVRDLRLAPHVTPNTVFNDVGAVAPSKMRAWWGRLYSNVRSQLTKRARDVSSAISRAAMNSWEYAWTGGWYERVGAVLWNNGKGGYQSETGFWNAWRDVLARERGLMSTSHVDIPGPSKLADRKVLETTLLNHNLAYCRDEFRLKEDTIFIRGEKAKNWESPGYRQIREFIDAGNLEGAVGFQFTIPSYASASLGSRKPIWGVWDLVIYAPKGTLGVAADMASQHPGESEWTMMRNMTYQVRKVEEVNGRWRVHVDVVGHWDDQGRMIPDFSLPLVAGASSGEYERMAMAEYLKLNGR